MAFYGPRPPLGERLRNAAQHPFVAALLGGLVVLILGVVLIAAGAVGGEDKTTVVQNPIAEPATNASNSSKGKTVNQIYDEAGPGVAFVRAEVVQQSDSSIFGLPQTQRGEATGSGFVIDKEGDVL